MIASVALAGLVLLSPPDANPPLFPEAEAPASPQGDEPTADNTAIPTETATPSETTPSEPASEGTKVTVLGTSEPDPEIANLLGSDEPEAPASRPLVADTGSRERVDHAERMRGYYAKLYRPASNPARVYFAARGSYALTGSGQAVGGGRMGTANVEAGQTWNHVGYALGATLMAGGLSFGENGVEKTAGVLIGAGPSLGLGRLSLLGRGYVDFRVGYNFFYAPVQTTRAGLSDPPDAAPHGPKAQLDIGLLLHDAQSRRFRHGFGASLGWQMLVHSFAGEFPLLNSFNVGINYFFG